MRVNKLNPMVNINSISEKLNSLSSPTRLKIVEQLTKKQKISVSQIARPLKISLPGTLKHLKNLKRSGIIDFQKDGRTTYCFLNRQNLKEVLDWFLGQKMFWDQSLDKLEKHLKKQNERK